MNVQSTRARCARRQVEAMCGRMGGHCFNLQDEGREDFFRYWWGRTFEHAQSRMRQRRGVR